MNEQQIRDIVRDEMENNYRTGAPRVPRHTHDGIDNTPINALNVVGFEPLPSSGIYQNVLGQGGITSISIASGGSGYTAGDEISINGGYGAIVTVGVSAGVVNSIVITSRGQSYSKTSGQTTSGGTGTGLTVNILTVNQGISRGFSSNQVLESPAQEVVNSLLSIYPNIIVLDNTSGMSGGFQGGFAPEGTIVLFQTPYTFYELWARIGGAWRGISLNMAVYDSNP